MRTMSQRLPLNSMCCFHILLFQQRHLVLYAL
uniref:Uncharacterized protein n=1 Tax=Parascaris equorum TaxID=6256 RepID=A0A914RMZ4_PAREQ